MKLNLRQSLISVSAAIGSLIGSVDPLNAAPTITETTTGSAGAWVYNFSITNTLGGANFIYAFGVISSGTPSAQPAGWQIFQNFFTPGGAPSGLTYNVNWNTSSGFVGAVTAGNTLDGFQIQDSSATAQTAFNWFGYSYANGAIYTGSDYFGVDFNPGFEGTASAASGVPEPATWAMMLVGFGCIGFAMRRKDKAPKAQIA